MECVGFRNANSGLACSLFFIPVMNASPCRAANCAVSLMTSRSRLATPSGAFTVNASLFGATRTLATAAPAAATATVPEAAFAAFAASSAFFATAAASPPAASSLNAAILLL